MDNRFHFLSPQACDDLNAAIQQLPRPGGSIRYYDAETRSLVVLGIDKRDGRPKFLGWTIWGALTPQQAAEEIERLEAESPFRVPVKH